jgi:hypothetical protein
MYTMMRYLGPDLSDEGPAVETQFLDLFVGGTRLRVSDVLQAETVTALMATYRAGSTNF